MSKHSNSYNSLLISTTKRIAKKLPVRMEERIALKRSYQRRVKVVRIILITNRILLLLIVPLQQLFFLHYLQSTV